MIRSLTRSALLTCALLAFPACDSNDDDGGGGGGADFRGCPTQIISLGASAVGAVSANDCEGPSGDNADLYRLRLPSDRSVTISAEATDPTFDSFLTLYSSSGTEIETDDDGGAGTNALITRDLDGGEYVIEVSRFFGDLGPYWLRVE